VVLTASSGAFPGLAGALRGMSLSVEECPLLDFAPPADWEPLDRAIRGIARYGAVAFTSPRAARAFVERFRAVERRAGTLPPVWSGGSGTASALTALPVAVRTPPEDESGELGAAAALAAAMLAGAVAGPVLFPCGEMRRDELPTRLRQEGIAVDEVVCYRSVLADEAKARGVAERASILVVASPSVAELLARVATPGNRPRLLAVGPTTAAAARASGWPPAAVAAQPTLDALLAGMRSLLAGV
jgi:uroporphyrinogen-III synthase